MKLLRKGFALVMAMLIVSSVFTVMPLTSSAKTKYKVQPYAYANFPTRGTCGTNAKYTLKNSVLTITGTGEIKKNAFKGKTGFKSVVIKSGITSIGEDAFDRSYVKNVTLPNTLKTIGAGAFYPCYDLKSVKIPSSVEKIGAYAFGYSYYDNIGYKQTLIGEYGSAAEYYCKNIYDICYEDEEFKCNFKPVNTSKNRTSGPCGVSNVNWKIDSNGKMTIYGKGSMFSAPSTKMFDKSKVKEVVIEDGVTSLANNCFKLFTNLKKVTIPSSVTSIGSYAFYRTKIDNIALSSNVKSVGDYAFAYTNISDVGTLENVTKINDGTFIGCKNLKSVKLSDKLTTVDYYAFTGCKSLTSLNFSDTLKSLRTDAIAGCDNLANITIDPANPNFSVVDSVIYTKDMKTLVAYPASLENKSYKIPNTVKTISSYAFQNTKNLEEVEIPDSVTTLETGAFYNSGIKSVTLPKNIKEIPYNCFANSNLESFTVPKNVYNIGTGAFYDCKNITKFAVEEGNYSFVTIDDVLFDADKDILYAYPANKSATSYTVPSTVGIIIDYAFSGAVNLKSVNIPSKTYDVQEGVFDESSLYNDASNWNGDQLYISNWLITSKNVSTITVKSGTVGIARKACYNLNKLSKVVFPTSLKTICDSAFLNCPKLLTVTVPKQVTTIDDNALGCQENITTTEEMSYFEVGISNRLVPFTIKGYKNSGASRYYARKHGDGKKMKFVTLK